MSELILVRHGETDWNASEVFRGRADVGLNETGLKQAQLLGGYLGDVDIEAVYSSPLQRARRTAEAIAAIHKIDITVAPGLVDLDYGDWQGLSLMEVRQRYPGLYARWESHPELVRMPSGESLGDIRERTLGVVNDAIARRAGAVVLVSHRVVNKVLICALLGLDDSHFWDIRLDTCGLSRFSYLGGRYILTSHNDTSYLASLRRPPLADF